MSQASPNLPDAARLSAALGVLAPRFAIEVVAECESTNTVLMSHPPEDDGRVHVLVAHRQTAGRGRRGRRWASWDGLSLTFSSIWRFDPGAPVPAGLSLVAGLALARAVEALGARGVGLKWPNDLLAHGAKLAGILVELIPGRGRTPAAVVGIGVNLALPEQPSVEGQAVTSVAAELGRTPDANLVLAMILRELYLTFLTYAESGFAALRPDWEARNVHAGLPVRLTGERGSLDGICMGVADDGSLLLDVNGERQCILSGEVSLRSLG